MTTGSSFVVFEPAEAVEVRNVPQGTNGIIDRIALNAKIAFRKFLLPESFGGAGAEVGAWGTFGGGAAGFGAEV